MHVYTRTRLLRHPQTGGKESLDHSFRRTESLSSVGSQRSLRSFMSATPSRGLSVRQGRHASSPGDGDVSDAPFEFPKRLSAEELQQQLAYLEQALRDADRRNTGKLKRQVRSSFALLRSNSCDFCFSCHGLCASKRLVRFRHLKSGDANSAHAHGCLTVCITRRSWLSRSRVPIFPSEI